MTESLLYSSAPVFEVEGRVRGELARDLVRLVVEEATDGLRTLAVRFVAFGPKSGASGEQVLYLDGQTLDFGTEIAVSVGPSHRARRVFRGWISAIQADFTEGHEPEVVAFAEDELMSLRMTRRNRTYRNMSDADVAREIAGFHGLRADVDVDGPTFDVIQQWSVSDLAFLRERAGRMQAELSCTDGVLHLRTRTHRSGTPITLVQGNHLISLEVRADLAHQRTGVRVCGFDAAAREAVDEECGAESIEAEIAGGRTGPCVLERAFGRRISHRVREVPLTTLVARAWARAEMLRRGRGFVRARGVTRGTPEMSVGSRLTLERVGAPFEGPDYYVTRVRHTYDLAEGHRTHFEAERATIGEGR